jgi:transcriptional regulator with XRE-family HTH domain
MSRQPNIGQRLAAARLQRGLSQAAVAERAGIAPSYLSRIENSKVQSSFRTLSRVARAIDIPFDELAVAAPHPRQHGGSCPVSESGYCQLDLIHADTVGRREGRQEYYTVRQVKLLGRFASLLRAEPPERLNAIEVLIAELSRASKLDD